MTRIWSDETQIGGVAQNATSSQLEWKSGKTASMETLLQYGGGSIMLCELAHFTKLMALLGKNIMSKRWRSWVWMAFTVWHATCILLFFQKKMSKKNMDCFKKRSNEYYVQQ